MKSKCLFFYRCSLQNALEENSVNMPPAKELPFESTPVPYVIVADGAFPMRPYLMKPFAFRNMDMPQRVFNYRLSRTRRIIENVFGICAARFRILRKPIENGPEKVVRIVLAICALHNYLMTRSTRYATSNDFDIERNGEVIEGEWRSEIGRQGQLQSITGNSTHGRPTNNALEIREHFKNYFVSAHGEVNWQYTSIVRNLPDLTLGGSAQDQSPAP